MLTIQFSHYIYFHTFPAPDPSNVKRIWSRIMCPLEILCLIHDASLYVTKSTYTVLGMSSVHVLAILGKTFKSALLNGHIFISFTISFLVGAISLIFSLCDAEGSKG